MNEINEQDIKSRIFNSAVRLFAQRSYGLVGVREIAQDAGVSISMISYHFGGKAGILEEILNRYFDLFKNMFDHAIQDENSFEESIRRFFAGMVDLIRRERDLSMIWFTGLSTDIPELRDVKRHHHLSIAEDANKLLGMIGLDIHRDVEMINILSAVFIHMVYSNFISNPMLDVSDQTIEFDDAYYDRYVDIMTNLSLKGINGLFAIRQ